MNTFVYTIGDAVYINLTNKCTNRCSFCVRDRHEGVGGYDLRLDREPSVQEVLDQLKKMPDYSEAVFCGYGEPMIRLEELKEIAEYLKSRDTEVRINTNGHANLVHKRNVVPELKGIVDVISISLNAPDPDSYHEVCNSIYKRDAFSAVIEFAKQCSKCIDKVILSVVDVIPQEEIEKCREIAKEIGTSFRIRHMID